MCVCILMRLVASVPSLEKNPQTQPRTGLDMPGRGGAGGSLSKQCQASREWNYWGQTGIHSNPDAVTS